MPVDPYKASSHPFVIAKANFARDPIHWADAIFNPRPRRLNAQSFNGACRSLASFAGEQPTELAGADARGIGETLDRKRFSQMLAGEAECSFDPAGYRFQLQHSGELRLPPWATMIHDQVVRHSSCHLHPAILFDQRQREVDPGRNASRRPDVTVLQENAVSIDLNAREATL